WLARYCNVRHSVCLAVDGESGMLVGLASSGIRTDDVELFTAPLTDGDDPLVAALASSHPTAFPAVRTNGQPARGTLPRPLGVAGAFVAYPLRGSRPHDQAVGLLLLRSGIEQ